MLFYGWEKMITSYSKCPTIYTLSLRTLIHHHICIFMTLIRIHFYNLLFKDRFFRAYFETYAELSILRFIPKISTPINVVHQLSLLAWYNYSDKYVQNMNYKRNSVDTVRLLKTERKQPAQKAYKF